MAHIKCLLFLAVFFLSFNAFCQINYQVGDTLNVVAINGLNLRSGASTGHQKVVMLENGEKVVVTSLTSSKDSIEFQGYWVKIKSVKTQHEGFVFDAFVSKYPVVNNLSKAKYCKSTERLTDGVLSFVLEEYSNKAFTNSGCDLEYNNGIDGESFQGYKFVTYEEDARMIVLQLWEGSNSELELFNARPSESYYLVKNIIKQIPLETFDQLIVDERAMMFPEWYNWENCGLYLEERWCYVGVYRKNKGIISIRF